LSKDNLANVNGDLVISGEAEKATDEVHMFFPSGRENQDILDYTATVQEIVENVCETSAVVIASQRDAKRETVVLVAAKRSGERLHGT
jgi:hypothetical protein